MGYFLKIVIADNLAVFVDGVYNHLDTLGGGGSALLASIFFCFQLYGDFAGYSYIAIGSASVMGFTSFLIYLSIVLPVVLGGLALVNYLIDPGHIYSTRYIDEVIEGARRGLNAMQVKIAFLLLQVSTLRTLAFIILISMMVCMCGRNL